MSTHSERQTAQPKERTESAQTSPSIAATLRRYRTSVAIVIALAAALIIWLIARDNGGNSRSAPVAESPAHLTDLAKSVGHPIFWLGHRSGTTYELVKTKNGTMYVRYLPAGVRVGAAGEYLTVVTYPFPGAYAAIQSVAKQSGTSSVTLADGALAETSAPAGRSTNVHVAYPGVDYQVEVFDPTPGAAMQFLRHGDLAAFGNVNATLVPTFNTVSPAQLQAVAASLGHPIYWVGPKKGYTYQLARMSNGQVQIRYVPAGQTGASGSYLTIGTYPFPKALATLRRLAAGANTDAIHLSGGGLAVIDKQTPQSIHLAYPNSEYQIEVYDSSAAEAKHLVSADALKSIG
jgi:hypothetical protein